MRNFAYIDTQNLNLGIKTMGWKLDLRKFREFLEKQFEVDKAYMFLGYMPEENQDLYDALRKSGFDIVFKPLTPSHEGKIKGNIDADLVLQAMIDYPTYRQAVIVTSDGDFQGIVNYLNNNQKLRAVVSPSRRYASSLLQNVAPGKMVFLEGYRKELAYRDRFRRKPKAASSDEASLDKQPETT